MCPEAANPDTRSSPVSPDPKLKTAALGIPHLGQQTHAEHLFGQLNGWESKRSNRQGLHQILEALGVKGRCPPFPVLTQAYFLSQTTWYSCVQFCPAPCFRLPKSSSSSDRVLPTPRLDAKCYVLSYPCTVKPA